MGGTEISLTYKRGLSRVCVVLAAVWVVWAACKPMFDKTKNMETALNRANRLNEECKEDEAALKRRGNELVRLGEDPDTDLDYRMAKMNLPYCYKHEEANLNRLYSLSRETVVDTYWREGYTKIAAVCFIPPIIGYLIMLTGIRLISWIVRGFSQP